MSTPYELGTSETVWEDDCSSCPSYMDFEEVSACERQSEADGRCFRGDWATLGGFQYNFQLPPEWSAPVSVTYAYNYWALGEWDSKHFAGASHYLVANMSDTFTELIDFDEKRKKSTLCDKWNSWTASGGSFDPYQLWNASDGSGGLSLACYFANTHTFATDANTSYVVIEFWTWDGADTGIQGPLEDMAWVLSDFRVEFTPTRIVTTTSAPSTTKATTTTKPTTTTSIPTTTSKPTTTTSKPTTTETQSTTSVPLTTTTQTPTDRVATTSTLAAKTSTVQTTSAAPTQVPLSTEGFTTSGEVDSGGNSSNGFGLTEIALLSVGGGVMVALLFFLVVYVLRKNKAKEDDDCETVDIRMTRVISSEQMDEGKCEESEGDAEELHGTVEIKMTVERKPEAVGVQSLAVAQRPNDVQPYVAGSSYRVTASSVVSIEEESKMQEYVTGGEDLHGEDSEQSSSFN